MSHLLQSEVVQEEHRKEVVNNILVGIENYVITIIEKS